MNNMKVRVTIDIDFTMRDGKMSKKEFEAIFTEYFSKLIDDDENSIVADDMLSVNDILNGSNFGDEEWFIKFNTVNVSTNCGVDIKKDIQTISDAYSIIPEVISVKFPSYLPLKCVVLTNNEKHDDDLMTKLLNTEYELNETVLFEVSYIPKCLSYKEYTDEM